MSVTVTHPPGSVLPTHLDLPHTDDKPVENFYQPEQSYLLLGSLTPHLDRVFPDGNYIIGADSGIYWELKPEVLDGCRAPDWYFVPGVPRTLNGVWRKSYVMWQEKVAPLIVIEYVSGNGSEERDATPETGKFWVYEQGIKAAYYAIHDPVRRTLEVFKLSRNGYRAVKPDAHGRFRIPAMQLDFGIWTGMYHGGVANWLRAWDLNGKLLPTPEETEEALMRRAEALATKLRELGVDPDQL